MIMRRTFLLVLVSMIVSVIEMTVDPSLLLGRTSLILSGLLMVLLSVLFVRDLWKVSKVRK